MSENEKELLPINQIKTDGGTQPRASLDPFVVDEYAQAMQAGATFPPVSIFYDGSCYWLADGFHRLSAAMQLNRVEVEAAIRQGTRRDAVLFSAGANAGHGLRRTNADKVRAVNTLLSDPEWLLWSDSEIARRCGVAQSFVWKLRQMQPSSYLKDKIATSAEPRLVQRNGRNTYTMNTANIGGKAGATTPMTTVVVTQPEEEDLQHQQHKSIISTPTPSLLPENQAQVEQDNNSLIVTNIGGGGGGGGSGGNNLFQVHSHTLDSRTVNLLRDTPFADLPDQKQLLAKLAIPLQIEVATRLASGDVSGVTQAKKQVLTEQAVNRERENLAVFRDQDRDRECSTLAELPWTVTFEQAVVKCAVVICDPPYGVLTETEEWEPKDLESFTMEWSRRWANQSQADIFLIFWSQRYLWEGRKWFDTALTGYTFQHLLIWHYPNGVKPLTSNGFKRTYDPIFFYRRDGAGRQVGISPTDWGQELNRFDCHVAALPQTNYSGTEMKQHPAQKPLEVMRWLVAATTTPGELVADPFCGSGTTGIAAVQLGRRFHGIVDRDGDHKLAEQRLASYGAATTTTTKAFEGSISA